MLIQVLVAVFPYIRMDTFCVVLQFCSSNPSKPHTEEHAFLGLTTWIMGRLIRTHVMGFLETRKWLYLFITMLQFYSLTMERMILRGLVSWDSDIRAILEMSSRTVCKEAVSPKLLHYHVIRDPVQVCVC